MTGRVSYTQALTNACIDAIDVDRFVQALEHQGWVLRRTVTAQEHEALREVAVRAANGEDVQHQARLALGLSSDPPGPDDHEPPDLKCHKCCGTGCLVNDNAIGGFDASLCPVCDGDGYYR